MVQDLSYHSESILTSLPVSGGFSTYIANRPCLYSRKEVGILIISRPSEQCTGYFWSALCSWLILSISYICQMPSCLTLSFWVALHKLKVLKHLLWIFPPTCNFGSIRKAESQLFKTTINNNHRIIESPRLEKISKIIQSNHPPMTNISSLNHAPQYSI